MNPEHELAGLRSRLIYAQPMLTLEEQTRITGLVETMVAQRGPARLDALLSELRTMTADVERLVAVARECDVPRARDTLPSAKP